MSDGLRDLSLTTAENIQELQKMMEKLFTVTSPGAVFSAPVRGDDQTVITASEVQVGLGVGFGLGGGPHPESSAGDDQLGSSAGMGGGGGGGGGAAGRPIAVINISKQEVEVTPVIDFTKIALAFFTALGSMF